MPLDADREPLIHFAGRHRLSPALRDGAPVLVAPGDPGERCGWARFFAAPADRRLAAAFDPNDAASFRTFLAGASAVPTGVPAGGPGRREAAFAEARRFLAALRGRLPPA